MITWQTCAVAGVIALVAITTTTRAQNLWVVDSLQRPGSHFADLPPAVAAAAAGDWIWVRNPYPSSTAYTAPTITRPLTIFGEVVANFSRPTLTGTLSISGVGTGQSATIASLHITAQAYSSPVSILQATSNAGRILLIEVDLTFPMLWVSWPVTCRASFVDCADVVLQHCFIATVTPGNTALRSRLRIQNSRLSAPGFASQPGTYVGIPGGPGLDLQSSEAFFVDSVVRGSGFSNSICNFGCTITNHPGGPALMLDATSRATVGPGSRVEATYNYSSWYGGSQTTYNTAASGAGQFVTDPACTVIGGVAAPRTTLRVDQSNISLARLGSVATLTTSTAPGTFVLSAAGYVALTPLPTSLGNLWIEPQGAVLLGITTATALGVTSVPLPMTSSVLFGRHVAVQSALLLPNAAMTLSQPAFTANLPPSW